MVPDRGYQGVVAAFFEVFAVTHVVLLHAGMASEAVFPFYLVVLFCSLTEGFFGGVG